MLQRFPVFAAFFLALIFYWSAADAQQKPFSSATQPMPKDRAISSESNIRQLFFSRSDARR